MTQFQQIFTDINDKNEIAIAEYYGYNARRSTAILASNKTAILSLCFATYFSI